MITGCYVLIYNSIGMKKVFVLGGRRASEKRVIKGENKL